MSVLLTSVFPIEDLDLHALSIVHLVLFSFEIVKATNSKLYFHSLPSIDQYFMFVLCLLDHLAGST
jgi:hypothetical protein